GRDRETWRNQRRRQRPEELSIEHDAETFVMKASEIIYVLPVLDRLGKWIVFVVWNVVTDRAAFKRSHATSVRDLGKQTRIACAVSRLQWQLHLLCDSSQSGDTMIDDRKAVDRRSSSYVTIANRLFRTSVIVIAC